MHEIIHHTSTLNLQQVLIIIQALLVPAYIGSIVFTVFVLLSTEKYGSGTHVWDVPPTLFEPLAMAAWASEMTFLIAIACTKCSVLFFHRRLTKGSYDRRWLFATYVALFVAVAYSLAFILMLIFSCSPTNAYWKSYNPTYTGKFTCHTSTSVNAVSGALGALTDLYTVLLPCIMLWNLDTPRRQKIALNFLFSLGLLVAAAGAVRTYYLHKVGFSPDLTWIGFDAFVWAELEMQLALICASAPALRVCFRILRGPFSRNRSSARSNSIYELRRGSARLADSPTDEVKPPLPGSKEEKRKQEISVDSQESDATFSSSSQHSSKGRNDSGVEASIDGSVRGTRWYEESGDHDGRQFDLQKPARAANGSMV